MTHAASPVSVTSVSRFCLCNRSDSRACRTGGAGRGREATPSASSLRAKNANVNERLARDIMSAIYGEPVSCDTVYVNNGRKKVCVVEYGCNYEEYPTWRVALNTFVRVHNG